MGLRKEIDNQKLQINIFIEEITELKRKYDDLNKSNNAQQTKLDEQKTQLNEQKTVIEELNKLKGETTIITDRTRGMQTALPNLAGAYSS